MTSKLILINTDIHVVVPKEPTEDQLDAGKYWADDAKWVYDDMLEKAPQLTTPPVLRWEGDNLKAGSKIIAYIYSNGVGYWLESETGNKGHSTEQKARRAAEKALGLPEVEEV